MSSSSYMWLMTAIYFLLWVFLYFSELCREMRHHVFAPRCTLPCPLCPLEPGHGVAEPAPHQGLLRLKTNVPSTCPTTKTAKRLERCQNTKCTTGFNGWFLAVSSCSSLGNIMHKFSHRDRQWSCSSNPQLHDVQLFELNNLLIILIFLEGEKVQKLRGRWHVKQMKEKAKDVEMYKNLSMTYILVHFWPNIQRYKANPDSAGVSVMPRFSKVRDSQHFQAWPSEALINLH